MNKDQEQAAKAIEKHYGKAFTSMENQEFINIMSSEPLKECESVIEYLKDNRNFYKKVLDEEYRKKNPNSFRYREADKILPLLNEKGKLLKSIIETKQSKAS